jgi:hypothetical protein
VRFLAALVLLPAVALADPHPMSSGANPAPTTDAQVAMTAETLTIDMDPKSAAVRAAVTLVNQGAATKLVVGFPCAVGDDAGQIDVPCKVPLKVTARGKPVAAKLVKKANPHWEWPMQLSAGEQVELVVAYKAPLVNDRYNPPAQGMGIFTYRLTTGARWANKIGKLDITVNHMHEALLFVSPAGYKREPGRLTWSLTDYEPDEEVIVMPHPIMGFAVAGMMGAKTSADMQKKIEAGDFKKADLERVLADFKREGESLDRWLPMISKLGGVAAPPKARVTTTIAETVKALEAIAQRAKR